MGIGYKIFKKIHRESNQALEYSFYVNLNKIGPVGFDINFLQSFYRWESK